MFCNLHQHRNTAKWTTTTTTSTVERATTSLAKIEIIQYSELHGESRKWRHVRLKEDERNRNKNSSHEMEFTVCLCVAPLVGRTDCWSVCMCVCLTDHKNSHYALLRTWSVLTTIRWKRNADKEREKKKRKCQHIKRRLNKRQRKIETGRVSGCGLWANRKETHRSLLFFSLFFFRFSKNINRYYYRHYCK